MLIVVTSGKASPGVTSLTWALGLTWPRPVLVADCDPAGGDMAAGFLAGRVTSDLGLVSWSAAARREASAVDGAELFARHVAALPEHPGVWFLPGFTNATQGRSFTTDVWERLAHAVGQSRAQLGRDAIVDAGRLTADRGSHWPLLRAADRVLLTTRPTVRSVHAAREALTELRYELGDLDKVRTVVIGKGPYPATEVTAALGLPLEACIPDDRAAAAYLSDGIGAGLGRALRRSPLLQSASELSTRLVNAELRHPSGAVR